MKEVKQIKSLMKLSTDSEGNTKSGISIQDAAPFFVVREEMDTAVRFHSEVIFEDERMLKIPNEDLLNIYPSRILVGADHYEDGSKMIALFIAYDAYLTPIMLAYSEVEGVNISVTGVYQKDIGSGRYLESLSMDQLQEFAEYCFNNFEACFAPVAN